MKVRYIYIKSFEWIDQAMGDRLGGEPIIGRVYRALDEEDSTFYRIALKFGGIALHKNPANVTQDDVWACDYELITKKNILPLAITYTDLKMMLDDEDNSDPMNRPKIVLESDAGEPEFKGPENVELEDFMEESLKELMVFDMDMYESLLRLTINLADALITPAYIPLTDGMGWNSKTGKTTNVTIATYSLEKYLNQNNNEPNNLFNAAFGITTEIIRLYKTKKNNG